MTMQPEAQDAILALTRDYAEHMSRHQDDADHARAGRTIRDAAVHIRDEGTIADHQGDLWDFLAEFWIALGENPGIMSTREALAVTFQAADAGTSGNPVKGSQILRDALPPVPPPRLAVLPRRLTPPPRIPRF